MCIPSGNQTWKYFQGLGLERILGGNLKVSMPFDVLCTLCKSTQISNTNFQKLDLLTLIKFLKQFHSFCTGISNYMDYSKLETYNCL